MNILKRLLQNFMMRVTARAVEHQVRQVQESIDLEEAELRNQLAQRIGVRPEDVDLKLQPTANGFVVPLVELRVDVSPHQLAKLEVFLDSFGTRKKQNVRHQPGVH